MSGSQVGFQEAPRPADEADRLAALDALQVAYTPAEERFDRLARMACRSLRVPIATVTLIDADVQWFKAREGVLKSEDSRGVSFCAHAILQPEPLVVPDARVDPRFAANPLVTGEPFIRFYAGHPLQAPDGSHVGTLCVIDHEPRTLAAGDLEMLRDLAAVAESELRVTALSAAQTELIGERDTLRRKAMLDPLTGLWNRGAVFEVLDRELLRAERARQPLAVIMADIDSFKAINDRHGHAAGDAALAEVARRLRAGVRSSDAVGRYGGEEFLLVLAGCDEPTAADAGEHLRVLVAEEPVVAAGRPLAVTVSLGVAATLPGAGAPGAADLVAAADRALYRAKAGGRNRVEWASAASCPT
jgi:diguanylate cyclase (GGDEF)-like protein